MFLSTTVYLLNENNNHYVALIPVCENKINLTKSKNSENKINLTKSKNCEQIINLTKSKNCEQIINLTPPPGLSTQRREGWVHTIIMI